MVHLPLRIGSTVVASAMATGEAQAAHRDDTLACSVATLAHALAADTTRLRRVRRGGAGGRSTEGTDASLFYDGATPRVIHAVYYGETGTLTLRYYLQDSVSFVVDRDEVRYERPITAGPVRVATRTRSFTYFCRGRPIASPHVGANAAAKAVLTGLLRKARRP